MSIVAMEQEMENQPEDLEAFADGLRTTPIAEIDPAQTVFTGSGDSYAAALFARGLAKGSALAEDPYELLTQPSLLRHRDLVLISVSGRTKANLQLAMRARGKAKRTLAITASAESPLARICDSLIVLQYRRANGLTSGTTSFTTSLLGCSQLVKGPTGGLNLRPFLEKARGWASRIKLSSRGLTLFIGSGIDRALAEYGACKVEEVLGARASASTPEQVGHSQLFSLHPDLDHIVYIDAAGGGKIRELSNTLAQAGFRVSIVPVMGKNDVEKGLASAFCLQYLALLNGKKRHMTEVAFLQDKKRLKLSSRLIY